MKKLTVALISISLLTACSAEPTVITDSNTNKKGVTTDIFKDELTGCEYVIFDWYHGGGVTPRLDKNGQPTGCKGIH